MIKYDNYNIYLEVKYLEVKYLEVKYLNSQIFK